MRQELVLHVQNKLLKKFESALLKVNQLLDNMYFVFLYQTNEISASRRNHQEGLFSPQYWLNYTSRPLSGKLLQIVNL